LIRRHPVTTFFLLEFGITWVVWVPRAAGVQLGVLGQAWTWTPAIAALFAAALTSGRAAVRDLGARLVRWRVGWQWYLVVILGPAAFSPAVADAFVYLVRRTLVGGYTREHAASFIPQVPIPMLPTVTHAKTGSHWEICHATHQDKWVGTPTESKDPDTQLVRRPGGFRRGVSTKG
jgi:hypothetical protein